MGHVDYSQACPVAGRGGSVQQWWRGNCGSPVHATVCVPTPEVDAQAPPAPTTEPRRRGVADDA
jgi:hypothetical protein